MDRKERTPVEPSEYQARLGKLREEIDEIDGQLLPLFLRRMDCSQRVAQLKGEAGMPVFSPQREQAILDKVRERGWTVSAILLTHAHYDHTMGVPALREALPGVPVYVPLKEAAAFHRVNDLLWENGLLCGFLSSIYTRQMCIRDRLAVVQIALHTCLVFDPAL